MTQVLIVEDHEENRGLLKLLLEVNGYRVTVAGDGLEALAAARRDPPDVIVSDALMPNMDGFALCRAWMQDAELSRIPFVFYSSTYVRPEDEQLGTALGGVRYLIKPLEAKVFLAELDAVLRQWAGHAAPVPAAPLDDSAVRALHESAVARKLEDKIAQLEEAKDKLQESEARFRSLTEMSSDFYWESDAEHRLTQRASGAKKLSTVPLFKRSAQIGERRWDIPHLSPDESGWAAHLAVLDAHQPFREFMLSRLGTDGTERFISISGDPVFDASGAFIGYRGVGTDITARKRAEDALHASEDRNRDLVENSPDLICTHDLEGKLLTVNAAAIRLTGYSHEALLGMSLADLLASGARDGFAAYLGEIQGKGAAHGVMKIRTADGSTRWWEFHNTLRTEGVGAAVVRGMAQDITVRKMAEDAQRESEERFRSLTAMSSDFYWETDEEHRITLRTEGHVPSSRIVLDSGQIVGKRRWELPFESPGEAGWAAHRAVLDAREWFRNFELSRRGDDGEVRHLSISGEPLFDSSGTFRGYRGVGTDITERKRAEEALRTSEDKFRKAFQVSPDAINISRLDDGVYVSINQGFTRITGYTEDDVIGHAGTALGLWEDTKERARLVESLRKDGVVTNFEARFRAKDGSIGIGLLSAGIIEIDGIQHIVSVTRDISERERARQELADSEERFRGLVEQSIAGISIVQDGVITYANPRYAEIFGYAAEELIGQPVATIVADEDRALVAEHIHRLVAGEVRSAQYTFTGRRKDGSKITVGVHGSVAAVNGRPAIVALLQDISEKMRADEQIQGYLAQLENAFMSTVKVATAMGEMRDPYTAGHQSRVAEIAVAIGAELGFDARRQEGLRVAGFLHDIGKITIPAEILSKPGRLSPIEYQLVQGHARSSYDVLKDVSFPWPVAEVALQHHERIDGSGYPQGLKGETILLEARIMAVADVVEAMSSHRPYRAGLGVDKALAEIERGRGTAYDAQAADACLRLFREGRFQLRA